MADNFLSLLDLAKRRGTDATVGLVEEVITFAPEIDRVLGHPINGINYTARVRTGYSAGGVFRNANEGVAIGASTFAQKRFDCFFFDSQLQVDEAVALAAQQDGDSLGTLQSDEAIGAMRAKAITLGTQFYKGTAADAKGHPGLTDFLNTSQVVDAGGTSTGCERVWFIWMNPQGVHYIFGANQGIQLKPWTFQQVKDASNNSLMAYVSNVSGYLGLSCAHNRAVGCIKNIKTTISGGNYTTPVTDKLIAQVEATFPVGIQPNLCFMSRNARASLQAARTVTLFAQASTPTATNNGGAGNIAPLPTHTASGIPIVVTDSITTETAS